MPELVLQGKHPLDRPEALIEDGRLEHQFAASLRLLSAAARFEVVKNTLTSAAEEMKIVLAKTASSPLLKVAGDYSRGIFDIHGNMVAQGPDLPIHLGSEAYALVPDSWGRRTCAADWVCVGSGGYWSAMPHAGGVL